MVRLVDESGGGYARTPFRITDSMDRSGLDTQPAKGGGWMSSLLDTTRKIVEQRKEDEKRRQLEEIRRQEEQDRAERLSQDSRQREQEQTAQRRLNDPVWVWAHSAEGNRFLSSGGAKKVDYSEFDRDPDRFLANNDNLREFRWGFSPEDNAELQKRGVPQDVVNRLGTHYTNGGEKDFKVIGVQDYGGPVHSIIKDVTGNELAAGIGSSIANAATLGTEKGMAPGATSGPGLWADAAGSVSDSVLIGAPGVNAAGRPVLRSGVNALEDAIVAKTGSQVAGSLIGETAVKAGTRAALNIAEDVPLTGGIMAAQGADPTSEDFWKALAMQAGISGGSGAAVPIAGAVAKGGFKGLAVVPTELKTAAAAYIAAKQMGADEDEARTYAVMAAGGTSLTRRGVQDTIKTGLGMTDMLRHVDEVDLEGNPRRTPVMGAQIRMVDPEGTGILPDDYVPPELPPKPRTEHIVPPRPEDGIPMMRANVEGEDFLRKARSGNQFAAHEAIDAYKAAVGRVRGAGDDGTFVGSARDKLASLLNVPTHIVEAINPASKYSWQVLTSVGAAHNFLNAQAIELVGRQRQIVSDLQPLIGEAMSRKLAREAVRLAPAAAGVAGMEIAGGPGDEDGRKILATGLLASYGLHMGNAGVKSKLPFDAIQYTTALNNGVLPGAGVDVRDLPAGLKTGQGRLAHIILHPEDFNLSPEQLKAAKAAQSTLGAAFAGMQGFQKWANRDVTQDTIGQENRLFQWFTKDSVEKVLGKEHFPGKSGKPGFAADLPVEQQRQLGKNIVDAMINHPELRLDGDVVGLMMRDLDQKARVSSNAIIVKGLTSGTEGVDGFIKDRSSQLATDMRDAIVARDALAKDSPDFAAADAKVGSLASKLKAAQAEEAKLGMSREWGEIPGIEGYKFAPEILEAVKNLAVERNGEFGGLLDRVTSNIRTAMFTADLSAWTMQGWMLANRDPIGAIKAMPHVLAASILGDRYTAEWIKDNYMLSRKWAARGVVNGRMVDEAAFGTSVGKMPIIHAVESRGFSNALPLFRILMAEHMSRVEGLASMTGEGNAWGRIAGKLGGNDATRLAQFGARYGPMAAGLGVAVGTDGELDPKDWQDWFALALGAGGSAGMAKILDGAGKSALSRMPQAQRDAIETRVAKDINRNSGIMNKPQMGISQKQAQIERTFLFRSPALLRNTLIMAKLATTNTGPEGAMARLYLLQTGIMLAGASVAAKLALTGEMDSFNPDDPNSILNPTNFARSNFGAAGKISASNPLVSLVRAVFYHPTAEGEPGKGFEMPGVKDASLGLIGFGENRLTDVAGQFYKPGIDLVREGISGQPVENQSPAALALKDLGEGDIKGALGDSVGRMAVPIPIQEAASAGAFQDFGIKADPNYNSTKEKILGPLSTAAGFNYSPETRGQESVRRTDDAIRQQFPEMTDFNKNGTIDRRDLNDMQRAAFDASETGKELKAFGEETRALRPEEEVSQVDKYFAQRDQDLDAHIQKLKDIEDAVAKKTMSKFEYRAAYQAEQARYIEVKKHTDEVFKNQTMERPVFNPDTQKVEKEMSVVDYVNRGEHPEDTNVDQWFKLFDEAKGPNGKVDFDKLDSLQEQFKAELEPSEAAYLQQRLDSFKDKGVKDSKGNEVSLPALKEYEDVKAAAKPFWEIADKQFSVLQQRDPFFRQFSSYNDYKKQILEAAGGDALIAEAIESGLAKQHKALARFGKDVEGAQRLMRAKDLNLDTALADWYQRAPVNAPAYIANKAGDHTYDQQGMSFASGKRKLTQAQKLSLARKYGLTSPDFGTSFGYR